MKKTLLLITFFTLCSIKTISQNYYMTSPEGFGASTTGGGNSTPVTVTTYATFKSKLQLNTPQVILISGTITIPSGQSISEVVVNKTIIGLPGARLVNNTQTQSGSGILNLKNGSNNVIIRNVIFEGPGAYDVDGRDNLTSDGCTNLWVDHCEFQDGVDGNFDIKGNSDNVTVSWCKFTYLKPSIPGGPGGSNDHRFSNLIGSSSSNAPQDGHYSVTFKNCYWAQGCKARMPRARNAELHILNCYYYVNVSSSAALGLGGGINNLTCYVEGSNFANVVNVYQNAGSDGGSVSLRFQNCLNGVSNVGSVNQPTYDYTVLPVADVASFIPNETCGAGATLQVTADGELSTLCSNLSVDNFETNSIKIYPTIIDDNLTIEMPTNLVDTISVSIFQSNGQKVLEKIISLNEDLSVNVNLSTLGHGVYFCHVRTEKVSKTIRFIKK